MVVSLAILGIGVMGIFELFSEGLSSIRTLREHNIAVIHARSKMEELLMKDRIEEGESHGSFEDGYKWESRVSLFEEGYRKGMPSLYRISVRVWWDGGSYRLSTLRVMRR